VNYFKQKQVKIRILDVESNEHLNLREDDDDDDEEEEEKGDKKRRVRAAKGED